MSHYAIIGKGSLFPIIQELLPEARFNGFYDDLPQPSDTMYLGSLEAIGRLKGISHFIAIGAVRNMLLRSQLIEILSTNNLSHLKAVSPHAFVSPSAHIGAGTIVNPFVCINTGAKVGQHCLFFSNTTVEHDCLIEDNVNIAPGVTMGGNVKIGANSFIGVGAAIRDGITIGKNVVIGAGSLVMDDIADNVIVYGSPARIVRTNDIYRNA